MSYAAQTGFELRGQSSGIWTMFRNMWRSRDLIRMLTRKDFFVRYRRASFGILWVIALPLVQAGVLTIIFTHLRRIPLSTTRVPLPVYMFSGLLPWSFFTSAISGATSSIVDGGDLATKVYFPRAVLPTVTILSGFRGFVPSIGILIALGAALKAPLGVHLLLLIPATVVMLGLSFGFGLLFAALYVYFRDMKYVVSASIFPWFWASGVIFPLAILGTLGKWLEINPVVGMLGLFRASMGAGPPDWGRSALTSVAWMVALLACALPLYRRYDRVFVDLM